ncbi:H-NS family nucleoid-associated regulatory protein [Rhodanobacter denitrificans]|uniref:H-NS histone family protein n=1 Tax=Rhodanobacter denitrificans TaxID=666685 RepID=UPI001F3A83C0|nr:H-NS histone family protein [Rhodanobacter denitrificans]UJJ60511.1 H-NS histone family protein [Rhodanobacter denitrificans]
MALKLDGMSPRDLEALIQQAQALLATSRKAHLIAVRAKVAALCEAEGLQINDVFPRAGGLPSGRAGTGTPKYRNPEQPSQTWTGHGMRPRWFAAALKKPGVSAQTLLIDAPARGPDASKPAKAAAKRGTARR